MTDLLQIKEEKEIYKIIDGKLYAYYESSKEKRDISKYGCDVLKSFIEVNKAYKEDIEFLEKEIEKKRKLINSNYKFIGDLYKCGYCDLSKEVVEKNPLTGRKINTYGTHLSTCVNRKEEK